MNWFPENVHPAGNPIGRTFAPRDGTGRNGARLVREVRRCQNGFNSRVDSDLKRIYSEIREGLRARKLDRKSVKDALVEVIGLGVVALKRASGLEAYDVQVLAGASLARGSIVEMQTGEGKTLTTFFPALFHALWGGGVHVATVNAYLAERDFEFLSPALNLLGVSAGLSASGDPPEKKQAAYDCDVTFSTGYELGFDFLRDQVTLRSLDSGKLGTKLRRTLQGNGENSRWLIQRGFAAAIIDEVDSVLIDEAVTPLVLSASNEAQSPDEQVFLSARTVAGDLKKNEEYVLDEQNHLVALTTAGIEFAQDFWEATRLAESGSRLTRPWRLYVESALRAEHLMIRDVNYVVREDKVEIVDEYTGRIFSDRNWRDGLHQAVECKEGVTITPERHTVARISRQRYFQRYNLLCGMTGTARGHEREFLKCYSLPITVVPPRKPSQRKELPTRYFGTVDAKADAVVREAVKKSSNGQPVLIGTRTIAQSQDLSERLNALGREHKVLNGIQNELEATLIASAGAEGNLTVATNMAGRGTDIALDQPSIDVGGLHVIGFERSSSKRIDRQLIGRAGRQGDPGSGQFFVSADDDIVSRLDPGFSEALSRLDVQEGVESRSYDRRVGQLQHKAELASYQMRMSVMQEELWLNKIKKVAG